MEELGKARMATMPPPRKGSFWGGLSAKPALLDRRRQELQEWLFALIRDPVIAHSPRAQHLPGAGRCCPLCAEVRN